VSVDDVIKRLLNPAIIATVLMAGLVYGGWFLWALDARPNARLYAAAVVPGVVFLAVVWSIRGFQSAVFSTVYVALLVLWLVFAHAAFAAVLFRRWYRRQRDA
jgi:hypothetical protein